MSIKLLVNGFFRSGTTIVWKIFRKSNRSILSFYEPCHEEIISRLKSFGDNPSVDNLHNISVWDEYFKVSGLLGQIKQSHPNPGKGNIFPDQAKSVVAYARIYNNLDSDSILQTNRWALFLEEIHKELAAPIMHITRNPFDVYLSMQKVYFGQGSWAKQLIKNAFKGHFAKKAFAINNMYHQISQKFDRHIGIRQTKLDPEFNSEAFDMFFIAWSITNYYAIKAVEEGNGLAITYEAMLNRPDEIKRGIVTKFGLNFNHKGILRSPIRETFLTGDETRLLSELAGELNVYDKFSYIAKTADGERVPARH